MIIYLLAQSLAGTLALVNYFKLKDNIDSDLSKLIKDQYNQVGYEDKSKVLDKLQEKVISWLIRANRSQFISLRKDVRGMG
jgi:hypothetical protein